MSVDSLHLAFSTSFCNLWVVLLISYIGLVYIIAFFCVGFHAMLHLINSLLCALINGIIDYNCSAISAGVR